jgi:imidazolonepropionase-like amidohydrolase
VSPEEFDVKVLRWASVSPHGEQVVYQALGRLYMKDLPDGKPRRLTRQDDHMEMHPAWSPDGRSIAYTTWDDEKLGSIRVIRSGGGKTGKTLSRTPGHFTDPIWSPDGRKILFQRIGGGWITSPRWSEKTGIFSLPSSGGKETRIARSGRPIGFSRDGERIRLIHRRADNVRELQSVNASGEDMRVLATSKNATAIQISPNDRWLAFVERFQVHVMPWPREGTGRPFEIGPGSKSLPNVQLSEDAGTSLHFSGESDELHWVLGPDLFSTSMKETFAFTAIPDGKPPTPVTKSTPIGFRQKTDAPESSFALVGARILPMTGETILEDGTLWIVGNRIRAVGPTAEVKLPPNTRVVDASGTTIVPGFVDVHDHGAQSNAGIIPEQNWGHLARLAFGVTTIHDPSNNTHSIFAAAELARSGKIVSPRIYSTGTILYGAQSTVRAIVESLDDARSHLRRMKAIGARSVKSYNQPRRDQRQMVLTAARELEMMVVPEGGSLFQHNMNMVIDGHTGVEHSIPIAPIYEDVQQLWGSTEVGYTPTLTVAYGGFWGEEYWYHESEVWKHPRLQRFVPRFALDSRARRSHRVPDNEWNHFRAAGVATAIANAGGRVNIGAHGQREGLAAHWEMWMLAQGGMTPWQVLRSATINGAWYVGLDQDIGTLEAGKLADLVVLEKNPLEDIRHTDSVRWTILNGRMYDAATMNPMIPRGDERPLLFFEREADPLLP